MKTVAFIGPGIMGVPYIRALLGVERLPGRAGWDA